MYKTGNEQKKKSCVRATDQKSTKKKYTSRSEEGERVFFVFFFEKKKCEYTIEDRIMLCVQSRVYTKTHSTHA